MYPHSPLRSVGSPSGQAMPRPLGCAGHWSRTRTGLAASIRTSSLPFTKIGDAQLNTRSCYNFVNSYPTTTREIADGHGFGAFFAEPRSSLFKTRNNLFTFRSHAIESLHLA